MADCNCSRGGNAASCECKQEKRAADVEFYNRVQGHQAAMLMLLQFALECEDAEGRRILTSARAKIQASFVEWFDTVTEEG